MAKAVNPVYIVGAGPGDPELLTIKARRLLDEAEVVVYDRLVSEDVLALIPSGTGRIFAGKVARDHHMPQSEINALLVRLARSGRMVVRLKGGDPFVFGRGGEEAEELAQNGIPFEVRPGHHVGIGVQLLCRHTPDSPWPVAWLAVRHWPHPRGRRPRSELVEPGGSRHDPGGLYGPDQRPHGQ